MFNSIMKISKVETFMLNSGILSYISQKELVSVDLLENGLEKKVSIEKFDVELLLQLSADKIVCIGDDGILILDNDLKTELQIDCYTANFPILKERYLITHEGYNGVTSSRKYGLLDIASNEKLWITDWVGMIQGNGAQSLFMVSPSEIGKLSFTSGTLDWLHEVNAVTKGRYPFLIGQVNDLALFGLQDQDKLIALNVNSGELAWEIETLPRFDMLDDSGHLHSLTGSYFKMDASTGKEVVSFTDRSYFDEFGILSQRGNYAFVGEDHLITTDYQKGRIGAFNTKTFKFDWIHDEPDVLFPASRPIIYEEPYLLLQDNMDTLNIFKKE